MSQSRKFKRSRAGYRAAPRTHPLPPEWDRTQEEARAQSNAAMAAVQKLLPGRGLILITVPPETSTQDVEAMACVHNLTHRSQVASVFEAMLEWWSPDIITAHPDRGCVVALREGVAAVSDIPVAEHARALGETTMRVLRAIEQRQLPDSNDCLLLATIGLTLFSQHHAAQQHVAPGGSADASGAPPPQPLPPPRQWPKGNTKETLYTDLLAYPPSDARDQLIEMARAGKFHDWESDVATPKVLLIDILARFGFPDLAGKARDGGYDDEHPTVVQQETLRADVGAERYDSLMGSKPRGSA